MSEIKEKKRLLLYHHYDRDDMVDAYVEYALEAYHNFGCEIIVTTNSNLSQSEEDKLYQFATEVIRRENIGYDFGAWREVLLSRGQTFLAAYDELILTNSSYYGPLFPLPEMFTEMEGRNVDFWGQSLHTSTNIEYSVTMFIPEHVQSYFYVFTPGVFNSEVFREFWANLQEHYPSLKELIIHSEMQLTKILAEAGFTYSAYLSPDSRWLPEIAYTEPFVMHAADWLIKKYRMPFLKYKSFYKNEARPFTINQFIFSGIEHSESKYPVELIINHLRRTTPLSWQKNLPDTLLVTHENYCANEGADDLKIAVYAGFSSAAQIKRGMGYIQNIRQPFDFYATVSDSVARDILAEIIEKADISIGKLVIRVVSAAEQTVFSWAADSGKEQLNYDIALRIGNLEDKAKTDIFTHKVNDHLWESLLGSASNVQAIIGSFARSRKLGMVFPPYAPHMNMLMDVANDDFVQKNKEILAGLGLKDTIQESTVDGKSKMVFPVGGFAWYRPQALAPLLNASAEDKSLQHVEGASLERSLAYISQATGYFYRMSLRYEDLVHYFQMYEDKVNSEFISLPAIEDVSLKKLKVPLKYTYYTLYLLYKKTCPRLSKVTLSMELWCRELIKRCFFS